MTGKIKSMGRPSSLVAVTIILLNMLKRFKSSFLSRILLLRLILIVYLHLLCHRIKQLRLSQSRLLLILIFVNLTIITRNHNFLLIYEKRISHYIILRLPRHKQHRKQLQILFHQVHKALSLEIPCKQNQPLCHLLTPNQVINLMLEFCEFLDLHHFFNINHF